MVISSRSNRDAVGAGAWTCGAGADRRTNRRIAAALRTLLIVTPQRDRRAPADARHHDDRPHELHYVRDLVIAVEHSKRLENVLPVVAFDLRARMSADQYQLQRSRSVRIHRDVEKILTGPPAHDRGAERIRAGGQECDHADERNDDLRGAAAGGRREIA